MTPELQALIDRSRIEKADLQKCEQQRVILLLEQESVGRDHLLADIDRRIAMLATSRVALLHKIIKLTPGYSIASRYTVENYCFDEAIGTVRFNKRHNGCFTFGMPKRPTMALWVDVASGTVMRSGPIDW